MGNEVRELARFQSFDLHEEMIGALQLDPQGTIFITLLLQEIQGTCMEGENGIIYQLVVEALHRGTKYACGRNWGQIALEFFM